jgi:hypothetical protein
MARPLPEPLLQRELHTAMLATAVRFGRALRRFEHRRRRFGYDYPCSRLFDEMSLARSLLIALADEARRHPIARRPRLVN